MNRKKTTASPDVTWAEAFRDVTIKAITSGKLVPFGFLSALCIMFWRMDSRTVIEVVTILVTSHLYATLGWLLFAATVFLSVYSFKEMQKVHNREVERLVQERNALQATLTNGCVQSSAPAALEMKKIK